MIQLLVTATLIASFECRIEPPQMLFIEGRQTTLTPLALAPDRQGWTFQVAIDAGNPMRATVTWPGDPMQAAGSFPAIATSKASYAFSAYSAGPCLFTETSCLTQFNLVDHGNRTAEVILTPSAIATVDDKGSRKAMFTVVRGQCSRTDPEA